MMKGQRNQRNAEIFLDTMERYTSAPMLRAAVLNSMRRQRFFAEDAELGEGKGKRVTCAKIVVSEKKSIEAAEAYVREGKRVCVLNFASATTPGGGVIRGSSAQEECICRTTTLYPCLNNSLAQEAFYTPHIEMCEPLANDDCIYTPDVCVFKSDADFPEPLPQDRWWRVNIITCAAPNLYSRHLQRVVSDSELRGIFKKRIRRIFEIAATEGNDVVILGAFGCGAFGNSPELVSDCFFEVMQDYLTCFDVIEYAVFHTEQERRNYEAFRKRNGQPPLVCDDRMEPVPRNNVTELVFIIDRSGSMAGFEEDTVGGFNATIEKQRKKEGRVYVSTVLFDNACEVLHDRADIEEIKPMTRSDYQVGGCTALFDAIGGAIHHIGTVHKYARPEDVPEHTIFVITTDGMENASHSYSALDIKRKIKRQTEKYGWEFIFLAANIDAAETAETIGIRRERAASYRQTKKGVGKSYYAMSEAITSVRCGCSENMDLASYLEEKEGEDS